MDPSCDPGWPLTRSDVCPILWWEAVIVVTAVTSFPEKMCSFDTTGNQLKWCVSEVCIYIPWDQSGLAVLSYPFKPLKSFISRGFCTLAVASWKLATVVLHPYFWGFAECYDWVSCTLHILPILNSGLSRRFNQQQHKKTALLPLCLESCSTIPICSWSMKWLCSFNDLSCLFLST